MDVDDSSDPAPVIPEGTQYLPAPWSVKSDFRFSRDWPYWPSAGELPGSEVSNVQQAQYGMMVDNLFEHIKVEVIASKARKAKKITGEIDEVAVELAADTGAQAVIFDMLERFELEDGTVIKKAGTKNVLEHADAFRAFLVAHGATDQAQQLEYIDDSGRNQRLDQVLQGLEDSTMEQFYPRAGRAFVKYIKDRDAGSGSDGEASVGAPSLADEASVIDDDDDEPQQARPRGGSRTGKSNILSLTERVTC